MTEREERCNNPKPGEDGSGDIVQATVTDPLNDVESMTYGTNGYFTSGNILTDTGASGTPLAQTSSYSWDPATNLLLSTTDALGRTTSYAYDALGNQTSITYLANTSQAVTATAVYDPTFSNPTSITDPLQHTTTFGYDSKGNLTTVTNALQQTATLSYNSTGQLTSVAPPAPAGTTQFSYTGPDLTSITDPLGNIARLTVDGAGRVISGSLPLGQTTSYQYNGLDELLQIQNAIGGITGFGYDPNGNLLSVTDALQRATTYAYDARNRAITRTDPIQHSEHSTYDLNDNLAIFTDRKGQATGYSYDALSRLQQVQYADQSTITYTYDAGNRVTQIVDSISGTITRQYDDLDRLIEEQTPQGSVSYSYDAAGRRTSMSVSGQANPVTYAYDNANRLTQIAQSPNVVTFAYDAAGRRISLTLPNGIAEGYTYDGASELTGITYTNGSSLIGTLTYAYDHNGNRVQVGGTLASTGLPTAVSNAVYNANNQLQQWGDTTFSYDLDGNTTGDGTNTYSWDTRNQLSSITGSVLVAPQYDALGRRILNPAGQTLLYDGTNIVQEQASSGSVTVNLLTGLGVDEHFLWTDSSGTYSYLTDGLNSTIGLADSNANWAAQYFYDPFGSTTSTGSSFNALEYTGRENDGTGLYYYRARYYSPQWQRFVSEDPIGFVGSGPNTYAYVDNDPLLFVDPRGTSSSFIHIWETYDAARALGFPIWESLQLGWEVQAADFRPGAQDTDAEHANGHAMAGTTPTFQSKCDAFEGTDQYVREADPAGAIHAIQDSYVHQYAPWNGGYLGIHFPGLVHFWNDQWYNSAAEAATEAYLSSAGSALNTSGWLSPVRGGCSCGK